MSVEKFSLPEAGTKFQFKEGKGSWETLLRMGFENGQNLSVKQLNEKYKKLDSDTRQNLQKLIDTIQGDGYVYAGKEYEIPELIATDADSSIVENKGVKEGKTAGETGASFKKDVSDNQQANETNIENRNATKTEVFSPNLVITNSTNKVINKKTNTTAKVKVTNKTSVVTDVAEEPNITHNQQIVDEKTEFIAGKNKESTSVEQSEDTPKPQDSKEQLQEVYKVQSQSTDTMEAVVYRAAMNDQLANAKQERIQSFLESLTVNDKLLFTKIANQMKVNYPDFKGGDIVEFSEAMVIKLQAIAPAGKGINNAAVEKLDVSAIGEYETFPEDEMIVSLARIGIGDISGRYSRDQIATKINQIPKENRQTLHRIAIKFQDANINNHDGKIHIKNSIVATITELMNDQEPIIDENTFLASLKEQMLTGPKLAINYLPDNFDYRELSTFRVHELNLSNLTDIQVNKIITHLDTNNLEKLEVHTSGITNISFLAHTPNLKFLDVSNNQITTIDGLTRTPKIHSLDISNNKITNIQNITSLRNLQVVDISGNPIDSFESLYDASNLQEVYVSDDSIFDTEKTTQFTIIKK